MSQSNPYRRVIEELDPPDYLDGQVIERMRAMSAIGAPGGDAQGAHCVHGRPGAVVSRRRFVAAGAGMAACLGAVALGVGLAGKNSVPSVSQRAYVDRPFGLAIAAEAEPGVPVELETRPDSLMPIGEQISGGLSLKMNLACVGEGIESVTYTLRDVPTAPIPRSVPTPEDPARKVYEEADCVYFALAELSVEVDEYGYSWTDKHADDVEEAGGLIGSSFTVDLRNNPQWNGELRFDWGTITRSINVAYEDEFWTCDPVLEAKHLWLQANIAPDKQDEAKEYYASYLELFAQTCGTLEEAQAWLAGCHAKVLGLAADKLSQATIELEATFDDTTRALKRYRIVAVDNLEEAAAARFDALVERFGLTDTALDPHAAPFYNFDYIPAEDEPDPRLVAPLFAIVDVTE